MDSSQIRVIFRFLWRQKMSAGRRAPKRLSPFTIAALLGAFLAALGAAANSATILQFFMSFGEHESATKSVAVQDSPLSIPVPVADSPQERDRQPDRSTLPHPAVAAPIATVLPTTTAPAPPPAQRNHIGSIDGDSNIVIQGASGEINLSVEG